jgi:Asp-tRNA(Asn)/Glu-tRNA(Gln) amidotransferase A subunit family amidase
VNLLDLCAIAVPNGVLECGVPMGVTLIAPAWAEERLADIARSFEAQQVDEQSAAPLAARTQAQGLRRAAVQATPDRE